MVHRKTRQRTPISPLELFLAFLSLMVIAMIVILGIVLHSVALKNDEQNSEETASTSQESASENSEKTEGKAPEYTKIDFQSIVDQWVSQTGGNKSILIYDLERDEIAGAFNEEENYNTASLYKLFVVYAGYLKINSGEWAGEAAAGRTGRTILQCLDLAIRESNSECAETLWSMIGRDNLAEMIENDFKINDSNINSLISNPKDIMKIMKIFYEHKEINDEKLISQIKDSFLNQPATEYNWRQGLPSGFAKANVYNKVGWDYNPNGRYWNIYHDAAIVEFPEEGRHFIVVVMTNRVPFQQITKLGTMIEAEYLVRAEKL